MKIQISTLEEITLNITDGKHGDCDAEDSSGYYFISCKDVSDGKINYSEARQITEESFIEANKRTKLEENDILVTNSGTIGRMCLIKKDERTSRTTFQKSVAIIKPNVEIISPAYLYYHLLSNSVLLVELANGSAQKNLLLSSMRNFKVSFPNDLQYQRKVVHILEQYDSLIELNNKRIKLLEQMAENLYKEWFVRFRFPGYETAEFENGIPKGWEYKKLDKVFDVRYGKEHKNVDDGDIPIFGSGGVMRYGNRALYSGESVLIPRKGTLNNIMYFNGDFWTVDTMFYTVLQIENFAKYAYFTMSKTDMESFNSGAALPSMTTDILYHLKILVPDEQTLEEFDRLVGELFDGINQYKKENGNLTKQRNLLLPRLMSGKLEV